MAEVEIQLQVIIELLGLLIPEMQFSEKGAFVKFLDQMPLVLLDILFEFGLDLGVDGAIQCQDYRLLFTDDLGMRSGVHCLD